MHTSYLLTDVKMALIWQTYFNRGVWLCGFTAACLATFPVCMATADETPRWTIEAGTGVRWFHPDAINGLSDKFLQGRPVAVALTNVEPLGNRAISIGWQQSFGISSNGSFALGLSFERGEARYFLPDGAGPFRDPITATATYTGVTPTFGYEHELTEYNGYSLFAQVGAGAHWLYSENSLQSALLDVRDEQVFFTRFGYGEIAWRPSDNRTDWGGVVLRLQEYEDATTDLVISTGFQF